MENKQNQNKATQYFNLIEQIKTSVDIENLLLKLWALERNEIAKFEIDLMIEKLENYHNFKTDELQILESKIKKEI